MVFFNNLIKKKDYFKKYSNINLKKLLNIYICI